MLNIVLPPKQKKNNILIKQNSWYNYYAGYSDSFVNHYISKYASRFNNPTILDPWNGAGTTTLVSNHLGINNIGCDINPVMIIVSKAKLFNIDELQYTSLINSLTSENIQEVKLSDDTLPDLLNTWFSDSTVKIIRKTEVFLNSEIIHNQFTNIKNVNIVNLDNITAFFYMLLFNAVKHFCSVFSCSNPTWIKTKSVNEKIDFSIYDFVTYLIETIDYYRTNYTKVNRCNTKFVLSDSCNIQVDNSTVDIVMTSPPYCTRIDYVISTIVELAIIGFSEQDITELRHKMIGTPTIDCNMQTTDVRMIQSVTARKILKKIHQHNSKAAKTYYYKTYFQYFVGMQNSIYEIDRILKKDGYIIFVVQDSFFKDIFVNVSQCIREMFKTQGYISVYTHSFETANCMRNVNSKSRQYNPQVNVSEKIIIMRKEK